MKKQPRLNIYNQVSRCDRHQSRIRDKAKVISLKDVCPVCHVIFPTDHKKQFQYEHPDGSAVKFCYTHLLNITNRPGNYFTILPLDQSRNFDLMEYLNETMAKMLKLKRKISEKEVQATLAGMDKIFRLANIQRYIGGFSELFRKGGLKPLKHPRLSERIAA